MPPIPTLDPIPLLEQLIAIDSVNPDLVPGAPGEARIADFCARWLEAHGFTVHRLEARSGRPSIVGVVKGTGGGRSLMLNGHLDTVSLAGYQGNPLAPLHGAGTIGGRGSFDMKSGVAANLIAAARAVQSPLAGDVLVACVADEEFGSLGTEEVLRHFTPDAAIITEPSGLEVTLAHRGFAWFEVTLTGRAAHGSLPEQGIDAIAHAGRVLAAIEALQRRLAAENRHPILGYGAARVAMIHGGEDAATVAPSCRLTVERRTLPGQTPDAVEAELRAMLDAVARETSDFSYTLERLIAREAFEADPHGSIVTTLMAAAERILGHKPPIRGEPFWTDAGLFDRAGVPCLLFGVRGGGAHAATEWVETASLLQLTDILTATIATFCAGPQGVVV